MPLLGTRGAASARGFGFLGGKKLFGGWIATLGDIYRDVGNGIAKNSLGDLLVVGQTRKSDDTDELSLSKYSSLGTIQWQRVLGGANNDVGVGVGVDSSDNIYVGGYTDSQGAGSADFLIAKYDTDGTIQWQRRVGGAADEYGGHLVVSGSGDVYVAGYTGSQGTAGDLLLVKYNTSGTLQWQRRLGGSGFDLARGIALADSGNVYVVGRTGSQGAGGNDLLLAKYNSSGTIQWQRVLGGAGNDDGWGVAVDSSENIYVSGSSDPSNIGETRALFAKYNSSGTIQWQRALLNSATSQEGTSAAVDSSGNVYVTGNTYPDLLLVKYDTSGTIQWQRKLAGVDLTLGYGISVDSTGSFVYVTAQATTTAGGSDILIAKFPGDGLATGTHGPWTYSASSLTGSTPTLTSATSTLTAATSTLANGTTTLTSATSTLTFTVTQI